MENRTEVLEYYTTITDGVHIVLVCSTDGVVDEIRQVGWLWGVTL